MRKTILSSLLLPLFVLSLSSNAAPVADPPTSVMTATSTQVSESTVVRLDLNKANVDSLQAHLIGIGKTKAQAIVDYRDANGPFKSVDELLEIKGIGSALLERNRDRLMVE